MITASSSPAAAREILKLGFPFVYLAVMRSIAQRRPYRCPQCGAAIEAS